MKTIILPGYSSNNREWAYEVKNKVKIKGQIVVHEWEHWDPVARKSLSIKREIERLGKLVGSEKVNLVAKSVGTRVAMHMIIGGMVKINKLILCGIPTKGDSELILGHITLDESENIYTKGLKKVKHKNVVVFQNEKDPFASYEDIKKFIGSINSKIKIIKKQRSDHNYPYYEDFSEFLS